MKNRTIAVDLAKNVFEIGISTRPGQVDQTYRLSRGKFVEFFAKQEPATVVMEACGSSHHWGRTFEELGHRVVLVSPQYVTPYVVRNKTDRADVKGILEAYRNSEIHPVPIKTIAQQVIDGLAPGPAHMDPEPNQTDQHASGTAQ
jgi:transposase